MCYNKNMKRRKGFTLIELSLALIFVGVLALTVALVTNDMVVTYRRGLTLTSINTVGMDLVDDMRTAFASSSAKSIRNACVNIYYNKETVQDSCIKDGGKNLTILTKTDNVEGIGDSVPVYGALCTGTYSYLWNSGYSFNERQYGEKLSINYNGNNYNDFALLKVEDKNRDVCLEMMDSRGAISNPSSTERVKYGSTIENSTPVVTNGSAKEPEVILNGTATVGDANEGDNTGLALYDLSMATPAESEAVNGVFYSVSFILGTLMGGININVDGGFCKAPESGDSEEKFDYCAINKFNFAVQATGE